MAVKYYGSIKFILLGFALTASYPVFALSFEEYKNNQIQQYNAWKSEQDKAFYQFLKKNWVNKEIEPPVEIKRPKPQTLPVVETPAEESIVQEVVQPIIPDPGLYKPKELSLPIKKSGMPMNFYGRKLTWSIGSEWDSLKRIKLSTVDKDQIAAFWKTFAQLETKQVLDEFNNYSQQLNLNGWARLQLAHKLSDQIMVSEREQYLLTWALLVKLNEAVRLGYENNNLYLLYQSKQPLFNVNYWTYSDQRYYIFEPDGAPQKVSSLYTYEGDFSDSPKSLDLNYHRNPDLFTDPKLKEISFSYLGKKYQFKVPVSKNYADYLYSLPLQESDTYFNREPVSQLSDGLIPQLKQIVSPMSEGEAINFLLAFAQKGLKYKLDKAQFNRTEKYLLPEETLFYIYSDCEDHSFLFAWLVRKVLNIPIIGLEYTGHIATAVNVKQPNGKAYTFKNRRYAVADPTYINAGFGMEMPQFSGKKVNLIPIEGFMH